MGALLLPGRQQWRWWVLAATCAFLPDADVIGFAFRVPYAALWGHRGLTYSVLAAAVVASGLTGLYALSRASNCLPLRRLWMLLFLATVSHGALDAMTTGGLGVAFFSPFKQQRYFFGLRPIQVSPIGVRNFVGAWATRVLKSELLWVGLPCLIVLTLHQFLSRIRKPTNLNAE